MAGRDEEKVTERSGPAREPGRDPRVVRLEPRLLLDRPIRGRARLLLPGGARPRALPAAAARATGAGWLALAAVTTSVARLHLDHPGQLVRRRGDGGEPLLPEPPARRSCSSCRSAGPAGWPRERWRRPGSSSPRSSSRRSSTRSRPGDHATRPVFKALPAELTMLNDLSVFTETLAQEAPVRLRRQPRSATPTPTPTSSTSWTTGRSARRTGRDGRASGSAAARRAEVVLRAFDLAPVERVVLRVTGGPRGDTVTARLGWGSSARVTVGPGQARRDRAAGGPRPPLLRHLPPRPAPLARAAGAALADGREVGAFVDVRLVMGRRGSTAR